MNKAVKREKINRNIEVVFCLFLFALIPTVLLYVYYIKKAPDKAYSLSDPDCYMLMVRVRQLHETGQWYDRVIHRSNSPYGEVLHWTRPLDVILLGGAYFFSFFTDFDNALFFWAVMISPVILALIAFFLRWTALPLLSKDGPQLTILIVVFQNAIIARCQAGRPDHHSLMILLFVLSIGLFLRIIYKPARVVLLVVIALINALAIWVHIEAITWAVLTPIFLGSLWIWLGEDYGKKCFYYSASIAALIALFLLIERGFTNFASIEYDSYSIVHLYLFMVISIVLVPLLILPRFTQVLQRRFSRLSYSLLAVIVAGLAMWAVFPDFFKGPMVNLADSMKNVWFVKVNEVQPLFSSSMPAIPIEVTGTFLLALTYVLYLIRTRTVKDERICWIYILFMLVCFFALTVYMIRWAVYAQILITLLLAELTAEALEGVKTSRIKIWRSIKRLFIIIAVSTGFFALAVSVSIYTEGKQRRKSPGEIYLGDICQYLADMSKDAGKPLRIITHVDFGPEIIYRTDCEVVATPYHRNVAGITDTYEIMTADTDERALSLIDQRQADTILLCPKSTESGFYSKPDRSDTFYQRLKKDNYPTWLKKIDLPTKLSENFVLFKVTEH